MKKATKRRDVFDVHDPAHYDFGIRDSACELLALFLADKAAHQLIAKYEFEGIVAEYTSYREERVIRLLIAIATAYRLKSWKMTKEERDEEKKTWVGVLFPEGDGEGERLSMHEACNKIIHAEEFAFETRKLRKSEFAYAKQDMLISGKKGKAEWMAAIWIIEFADAALTMPSALNF
jgi:hypothetical protein